MAFIYKHWEVDGEQLGRIQNDPDSAISPCDVAVLSFLTLPEAQRAYALGYFAIGRFEATKEVGQGDCLHVGSPFKNDFQELARGNVVEDFDSPDGLYEIYVPI